MKRDSSAAISLSHTVRHVVPSCRARPRTDACSRRICPIAHQHARALSSARGRDGLVLLGEHPARAAGLGTPPGPLAPRELDRSTEARRVDQAYLTALATTISTPHAAPVIAGIRLRAGKAGSGKGAASMVREAITTARAAGAAGQVLVRGDSAYGNSAEEIAEDAWAPVRYPGAVLDPDTGQLISDAEVAETEFTAFASTAHPVTARLAVRAGSGIRPNSTSCSRSGGAPFFTNSTESTAEAGITHRRHAIIEAVFVDLIDGPLAHMPSGRFASNSAWAICAAMTHNLLRAAGTITSARHAVARGANLRRQIVHVPGSDRPPPTQTGAAPACALALG